MTLILVILSLSTQIAASVLALRLITNTGSFMAWIFIAGAATAQVLRRLLVLNELALGGASLGYFNTVQEAVGLAISILMLIGVASISPFLAAFKLSQKSLIESNIRYQSILEQCKHGFIIANQKGDIEEINPSALNLLGYSRQEALNKNLKDIVIESDMQTSVQNETELNQTARDAEVKLRHKAGDLIECKINSIARHSSSGAVVGHQIFVRDVTFSKSSEHAMRNIQDILNAILAASPVGISLTRERRLVRVNQAMLNMLGYKQAELLGQPTAVLYPDQKEHERVLRKAMPLLQAGLQASFDAKWVRKNKEVFDVYLQMQPIASSDLKKGLIITATEITERKWAKADLCRSKEKYRLLFEHANEAIFIIQDSLLKFSNSKTFKILQYAKQDIENVPFLSLVHPQDINTVQQMYQKSLNGEPAVADRLIRLLPKDGKALWVEMTCAPIVWEERPATLCFVRDITQQKNLERQIWHAQKLEVIGKLTRGVAHDFKNLLIVINEQSKLAINSLDSDHPLYKKIVAIREAGKKATSLTDLLVAFDRGQSVKHQIMDLSKVVAGMGNILNRITGKDIKIAVELQEDVWPISGNTVQLEQVLVNLVVNARDAMPIGGALTIETSNIIIHFDQGIDLPPGPYVMLAVSDDGCGMNPKTVHHIFEPFFTTKDPSKGSGLGLSTVYDIVKQMNGEIVVSSEPSQGTAFEVYLPIIQEKLELHDTQPEVPSMSAHNFKTLLVVEDDAEVRALVAESLKLDGYQVLAAPDSEEALKIVKEHPEPIALLISDVVMPKINGPQLIKEMKALRPEMNFILMSGYTERVLSNENLIEENILFLQKPFTLDNLMKKVRESLANANDKSTNYHKKGVIGYGTNAAIEKR